MKIVKILNTDDLDNKTKEILSKECYFIKEYIENETLFYDCFLICIHKVYLYILL